jgi:diguanylate cyclase (GGDEF)-like protein
MKTPPLVRLQFVIKLVGAAIVIPYCAAGSWQQFGQHWFVAMLLIAVEAGATTLPFAVIHDGARQEFSADFLVSAALLLPTRAGVIVLSTGMVLGFSLRRDFNLARLDDISANIIAIFLSLSAAHLIGQPGLGWNSIAGAAIASVIYEAISGMLVTIWSVLAKRNAFWPFFLGGVVTTAIPLPWVVCLGILFGVVGWDAPWALPLMGAPLALVFMATRSKVEATEDRHRLDGLLRATTDILAATTVASVAAAVSSAIPALFENQKGRIDSDGPNQGELCTEFITERLGRKYLIASARDALGRPYTEHDQRLLGTLASVTASALDKAALHEDVTEQATRDALTGLANRRAFEAELASSVIGNRSTDASGMMFLDLDGFKKINDEHGHKAGDEVLVETAKRLLSAVRDSDTVARLGGDEFTVLLRGVHNKDEAAIVAERILAAMRKPMRLSTGVEVHPTPSLGIALAAGHDTDPSTLLKDADAAMYEAKRAGKDCWRLAHDDAPVTI